MRFFIFLGIEAASNFSSWFYWIWSSKAEVQPLNRFERYLWKWTSISSTSARRRTKVTGSKKNRYWSLLFHFGLQGWLFQTIQKREEAWRRIQQQATLNPMKDQIEGYDVTAKISMGDVSLPAKLGVYSIQMTVYKPLAASSKEAAKGAAIKWFKNSRKAAYGFGPFAAFFSSIFIPSDWARIPRPVRRRSRFGCELIFSNSLLDWATKIPYLTHL